VVASRPALDPGRTENRITYVDGLRGVAIALVLVFHAWKYWDAPAARDPNA